MKEMSISSILCLVFLGVLNLAHSQTDSTFSAVLMGPLEMITHGEDDLEEKIISASQSLKSIDDLPFTVYVISRDDIISNGYVTLVDALKNVPGIRVSQPGSANEGETFLIRGLLGNSYTKILIDGIDIKPSEVLGLPIGGQLPIQQAEQIEIIYGPAAALYGADASAGVINIITSRSNRPLNVRAGLSTGPNSFSSVDLLVGGKIGKGKNILSYNIIANNTSFSDRPIYHTKDSLLFDTRLIAYNLAIDYEDNPNYKESLVPNRTLFSKMPHLSRMGGITLNFRSLELSILNMYRRDHSSIGLNPVAVSYADPLNYTGENITNVSLKLNKRYKLWGFSSKASVLTYAMDDLSSTRYILNGVGKALNTVNRFTSTNQITGEIDEILFDSLNSEGISRYFSGNRFQYSELANLQFNQLVNFYPSKSFELSLGTTANYYGNSSLTQYSPFSFNNLLSADSLSSNANEILNIPFLPVLDVQYDIGTYFQCYYTSDKLNLVAGMHYYNHSEYEASVNPRLAILYKMSPKLNFRSFFGTAFRRPPQFFQTNTYIVNAENKISKIISDLEPERTVSYEVGLRYHPTENYSIDLSAYHSSTSNLLYYDIREKNNPDNVDELESITLGYFNLDKGSTTVAGIQLNVAAQNIIEPVKLNAELSVQMLRLNDAKIENVDFFWNINEQPKLSIQNKVSFHPVEAIRITADNIINSNVRHKGLIGFQESISYYTLDLQARYFVNPNIHIYIKVFNVFDTEYQGLSATGTIDDLKYNPQQKRLLRLGVKYLLN